MKLSATTPILRSFDEAKAKEFYVGFLGFKVDWEHRFGDDFPLYMQVSRDDCILHISEHFGDATPGSSVRIAVEDIDALQQELIAKQYKHSRPGCPEETPWNTREMGISDPFGNRLNFYERNV
jgi:uncharacterized glyoxalase superfamily protein PhnB